MAKKLAEAKASRAAKKAAAAKSKRTALEVRACVKSALAKALALAADDRREIALATKVLKAKERMVAPHPKREMPDECFSEA